MEPRSIDQAKRDKSTRLAELSGLREYVARYGAPFSCPVSCWEISGGSSVEQLSRLYPELTQRDIRGALPRAQRSSRAAAGARRRIDR